MPDILPSLPDPIPLFCLLAGQSALVDDLIGEPDQIQRLKELGLRSGMEIEMVQPGSPCIIRVGGSKLCFRDGDVMSVLVRPGAPV